MDATQWEQEMVMVKPPFMEDVVVSSSTRPPQMMVERRSRSQKDQPLNCPRCNSTNTKFCYYNNYSLTQPRYFCKTCRRYWTEGGSLRNVPVGGGSRKNKRSSSSSSSNPPSSSSNPNQKKLLASDLLIASPPVVLSSTSNNTRFHETTGGHDLNLAFPQTHQLNLSGEYGDCQYQNLSISNTSSNNNNNIPQTCSSSSPSAATTLGISALPAMDRLSSSSGVSSRSMMMNRFIPNAVYPNGGFGLQNFRSAATLNFNVDGSTVGGGIGYHQNNVQEGPGGDRLLFPFEDLRQVSSTNPNDHQTENNPQQQFDQSRGQGGDSSGYWNGVIGSGTLW